MNPVREDLVNFPGCDIAVPPMGIGTWAWGDRLTWGMHGYDNSYGLDTIAEAYACVVAAGVTLFDTAEIYGRGESERILGRLVAADGQHRSQIVIASKFMPYPWRLRLPATLMTSLRASLARLGVPAVHLYQIHGPISLRSHKAMAAALAAARDAGLVQAVGISNYSAAETRAIHAALAKHQIALASNQIEFSLLRTHPEASGLLATCRDLGVRVLAYSPLGQGRLTGKYSAATPPPGWRRFSAFPMAQVDPVVSELRRIGARYGDKTPAQVALNWVICKGAIPIPGAKNRHQAAANLGALGWRLSDEDVQALDRVSKPGRRRLVQRFFQHG